ncbi:MAG: sugar transferase, partial [Enterococcus sp.]|nr:sugar transferase [Enterococcus sp.]
MYKKRSQTWLKHFDFALFDLIILAIVYIAVILVRFNFLLSYSQIILFTRLGIILLVLYLLVAVVTRTYKNILRRSKWTELCHVLIQVAATFLFITFYMFVTQQAELYSRIVFGFTALFGFILIYAERILWKHVVRRRMQKGNFLPWMLIVADKAHLEDCLEATSTKNYNPINIKGIALLDSDDIGEKLAVPSLQNTSHEVLCNASDIKQYVLSNVIDEILIQLTDEKEEQALVDYFLETGITVHIGVSKQTNDYPHTIIERMGNRVLITVSNSTASTLQLAAKRAMDIIGGIFGVILTGILYLFIAPQIKAKDKGPAFFKQLRIGKNGRQFYIYKFRSMYMDAEERKKELMDQNEMEGLMFKIENDPRILPGIGHTIRNRSLDEFPQFWNVLKGDMSLVGTRPPTLEEFQQYEPHHKRRLSFKPGLTGLWQVSGRSDITDFEKIVELDNQY